MRLILYKWDDVLSCDLAAKQQIDLSCLYFDKWSYTNEDEDDIDELYPYWGARLRILAEIVGEPKDDPLVWAWIKRRSGREYIMMVTLLGVVVAIVGTVVGPYLQSQESRNAGTPVDQAPQVREGGDWAGRGQE